MHVLVFSVQFFFLYKLPLIGEIKMYIICHSTLPAAMKFIFHSHVAAQNLQKTKQKLVNW